MTVTPIFPPDSPRALSEKAALSRLDSAKSSKAMYDALREELGHLSVGRLLGLTALIEQALADEYEAGWAARAYGTRNRRERAL